MRFAKFTRVATLSVALTVMLSLFQPATPSTPIISAQGQTCSEVVRQALDAAIQACTDLGRNRVCYVNSLLTAEPKQDGGSLAFNAPGDVIPLSELGTLKASPYDEAAGTWGVAMLRVQANLPGANVGQGVTMLTFGDTEVTDASTDGTLQSFYLRTGVGQPGCSEMPRNGVLLDSPTGQKVNMTVNGVQLEIGSTVFLFADAPEGEENPTLWVSTLKGNVKMTSNGVSVDVPAGTQNCAPLRDEDSNDPALEENGPPCQPTELNQELAESLPINALTELTTVTTPEATPDTAPIPTRRPTAVPTQPPTAVPPTSVPPTQLPPPPPTLVPTAEQSSNDPTTDPTTEPTQEASPEVTCQIDFFTANPTEAYYGQEIQLAWSISGSINFVQLVDPSGTPNEAASAGTTSYQFGTYQEGLPEGWTLQAFCTDESSATAGVTINPAPSPTEEVAESTHNDDNNSNR